MWGDSRSNRGAEMEVELRTKADYKLEQSSLKENCQENNTRDPAFDSRVRLYNSGLCIYFLHDVYYNLAPVFW